MSRRPSGRPDPTKLLLLAVSIVAALTLCEILARGIPWAVLHPPIPDYAWMAYDPLLGMVNVPGFVANGPRIGPTRARGSLAINAAGFRGPPLRESKPALRIACLGDSSTFGIWLEAGHAGFPDADFRLGSNYPERLAHRLRAEGIDAEVINAGVLGYHVGHGLRQLRLKILPLRPDVVVLRFGFNEHAFASPATHVQDPRAFIPRSLYEAVDDLALTQLLLARVQHNVAIPAVTVERFKETLTSMIARTRAQRATVLLLDYPLRPLAQGLRATAALPFLGTASTLEELHERHARYQEALRTVAAREGVPLVETASALAHTERPVFSDADLVHPNACGAAVIARQLARALGTLRSWRSGARNDEPLDVGDRSRLYMDHGLTSESYIIANDEGGNSNSVRRAIGRPAEAARLQVPLPVRPPSDRQDLADPTHPCGCPRVRFARQHGLSEPEP